MTDLIQQTENGLYCSTGDFYVDPWKPVDRAIITHAHSDHARWGSKRYLAAESGKSILRIRLGPDAVLDFAPFGKTQTINGVRVTFVPAGHILGSAQVRLEYRGEVVVVSGDYKRCPDPTCRPFEPVRCHTFVTESTFGLPIYHWPDPATVFDQINHWWRNNQATGKASLLLAYSLGKAQRLLSGIDPSIGPIFVHGAAEKLNKGYRESGVRLPETVNVTQAEKKFDWSQAIVIAPPSAVGSPWSKRLGKISTGLSSGWMQVRGTRRRRNIDRGFILSDHIDWQGLLTTIRETQAENIWVTHGYSEVVARYLTEQGLNAKVLQTKFTGEDLDESSEAGSDTDLVSERHDSSDA